MKPILRHMGTAVLCAVVLSVVAGDLGAQATRKKRAHRMFAAQTGPDEVALAWDEVPGATEYRIYLPDPASPGPPTAASRPWTVGSGSARRAVVVGVKKLAAGAYLEARAGSQVLFRGTFAPVTRAPLAPPSAPAAVSAAETGETEVTVSWDAVPGATAYRLGRAVGGNGFQMLCDLCPPEPVFVDTAATPGLDHTYTVEAIFPLGHSERVISEPVTVGAAQLAAAAAAAAPAAAAWDKPRASGTPVAGTDADNSNGGAAGGTLTPPTGTSTPTVSCPPGTVPITAQPKTSLQAAWNKPMASGTPVGGTEADNSNTGAAAATSTGSTVTPPGCTPVTPSQPTGTGGYTPPGTPAGTTSGYTPPGTSAGTTSTYTPPGTPAGTTSTYTPPGTPASTLPTTGTTTPASQPGTADYFTALVARIQDNLTYLLGSVATAGTTVHAATPVTASNDQLASWVGTIKGNLSELLGNISSQLAAGGGITHAATPVTTGATSSTTNDPLVSLAFGLRDRVGNLLQAVGAGTFAPSGAVSTSPFGTLADRIRGDVGALLGGMGLDPLAAGTGTAVHTATPITTTPPATSTPAPTSCRLDYQRADNMWAAFGRADGQLGTESISLAPGQSRVFVTDWKYEKLRNDGTNFYGSHLRIATNPTARPLRLQLRSTTLTGLVIFARTGSDTFWIRLDPNASKQFQADLMEVLCDN